MRRGWRFLRGFLNTSPMVYKISSDVEATPGATDSISDLSFSPTADYLAASSWDGKTRIWEVSATGHSMAKAMLTHDGPALCCVWSGDGSKVFGGAADKSIKMMDVATGQVTSFVAHEQPVRSMRWMNGPTPALITGSWDRTIKYWDLRQPMPVATLALPERLYSMDSNQDLLVVATAERHICIIDLKSPTQIFKTVPSPLKWQTRVVSCFHNATGYAIGSIEGRVGLQVLDERNASQNFAFKCHREGANAYAVNAISFHPGYGTFSTAGSDGYINFWDKDSRQRLEMTQGLGAPIVATAFNRNGNLFAYAQSYDWSKGHEHNTAQVKTAIMVHPVQETDVKSKQPPGRSSFSRR